MPNKLLTAVLLLALNTAVANAGGFYLGAGLSGEVEGGSFRNDLESLADADGESWRLFAGWELGGHLALEVSRYDLSTQRCCRGVVDLGFTSTVDAFSAAALGRWPLGRRFTPFVKAGVLVWDEDGELITLGGVTPNSADGTDLLVGAGFDFNLRPSFSVRADWERYEFGNASSDGLWASLLYRF